MERGLSLNNDISSENTRKRKSSYFALVVRQFKRNKLAMVGFWTVIALIVIALTADFIANDRPLLIKYDGKLYSPVAQGFFVDMGLARWPAEFRNKKF